MNYKTINFSNIFLTHLHEEGAKCSFLMKDHTLIYLHSGHLEIEERGHITIFHEGDCAFIRRDNHVMLHKSCSGDGKPYTSIALVFSRQFLLNFYKALDKTRIPHDAKRSKVSLMKIPTRPDITSLFESLRPYYDTTMKPEDNWIRLKMTEGLYAVLHTDKNVYASLFDFTEPWKIDLLGFMNENYMSDLSMQEMANFTGRSLSTFKRDFNTLCDLPPQKWLIRKRLEVAHRLIVSENKKIKDVMYDVGFKNLSHFSRLYKEMYGYSPTQTV